MSDGLFFEIPVLVKSGLKLLYLVKVRLMIVKHIWRVFVVEDGVPSPKMVCGKPNIGMKSIIQILTTTTKATVRDIQYVKNQTKIFRLYLNNPSWANQNWIWLWFCFGKKHSPGDYKISADKKERSGNELIKKGNSG